MPFFVNALVGYLFFIFLFGYPNQIPGSAEVKRERAMKNTVYQSDTSKPKNAILARIKRIFLNPIWIFTTIGGFCDAFLVAALMGYGMKFLQEQYSVSPSIAGLAGGFCAIGGFLGVRVENYWTHGALLDAKSSTRFIYFVLYRLYII